MHRTGHWLPLAGVWRFDRRTGDLSWTSTVPVPLGDEPGADRPQFELHTRLVSLMWRAWNERKLRRDAVPWPVPLLALVLSADHDRPPAAGTTEQADHRRHDRSPPQVVALTTSTLTAAPPTPAGVLAAALT